MIRRRAVSRRSVVLMLLLRARVRLFHAVKMGDGSGAFEK
jgi:hypothetical protein